MALLDDNSIIMSIKKLLNVEHNDPAFDTNIGMAINAEFMTLHQLGIGPDEPFYVNDADTVWTDFSDDKTLINAVKQYVFLKVRMIFDPPTSSSVAESYNSRIHELEFRMNVQAERNQNAEESSSNYKILGETMNLAVPKIVSRSSESPKPVIRATTSTVQSNPTPPSDTSESNYEVHGESLHLFGNLF